MLSDEVKGNIQSAYRQFLQSRGLQARYGQKLMIADIANTIGSIKSDGDNKRLGDEHICVVEAGTGTGKTVAYLLAAIPLAQAMKKKLVISTATVALQEQIVHKDLPDIREHTGLQFHFSLAKGRGRYLCLSKLDRLLSDVDNANEMGALYEDEFPSVDDQSMALYQQMVQALARNEWNGDRDAWPQEIDQQQWAPITTNHRQCTGRRCSNVGACSFFKARESLEAVECVVANHDLVLADLALGGGAILPAPEDTIYIFDEGHHLPDKALNHFAYHTRLHATGRWLEQSHKSLSAMLGEISGAGNIDRFAEQLPEIFLSAKQRIDQLYPMCQQLFDEQLLVDTPFKNDANAQRYRFEHGQVPITFTEQAGELKHHFDRLVGLLDKISTEVQASLEDGYCSVPKVDLEKWFPVIGSWQTRAEANLELWASYSREDSADRMPLARWLTLVEFGGSVDFEVCSSPILAAHTLEYSLWRRCFGAVVTSATLTALGKFDRFKMRAGTASHHHYNAMPSPFDFSKGLLQVPDFSIEANNAQAHTDNIITHLPTLLDKTQGSLVLFSSRRQMLDVYNAQDSHWQDLILMQGEHSKQAMLDQHKSRIDNKQGSVLFGLASFAEGVDLPGDYCRHVVIAKLPFGVPDDPVEASLAEWIEARGGNPFMEIAIPDAAMKLLQACGRLLRLESDEGTISILDRRIISKRYGKVLLNSLPPYRQQLG